MCSKEEGFELVCNLIRELDDTIEEEVREAMRGVMRGAKRGAYFFVQTSRCLRDCDHESHTNFSSILNPRQVQGDSSTLEKFKEWKESRDGA